MWDKSQKDKQLTLFQFLLAFQMSLHDLHWFQNSHRNTAWLNFWNQDGQDRNHCELLAAAYEVVQEVYSHNRCSHHQQWGLHCTIFPSREHQSEDLWQTRWRECIINDEISEITYGQNNSFILWILCNSE